VSGQAVQVEEKKHGEGCHNDEKNGQPDKKTDLPLVR